MASIAKISGRRILDSRGEWTIAVELTLGDKRRVIADVPRGRSTGTYEAAILPPLQALRRIEKNIAPKLRGLDTRKQDAIDELLLKLDGTSDKRRLGGNTLLGVSAAVCRAGALARQVPLWRHLRDLTGRRHGRQTAPRLWMNVINGGRHADNGLDFQEYLISPRAGSVKAAVEIGRDFYHALGERLLKLKGPSARGVGDEGGYAPRFRNNSEPFQILIRTAAALGLRKKIDFGLDAAASTIKKPDTPGLSRAYREFSRRYGLFYLEDPFGENDFTEFARLRRALPAAMLIAGDDLTVTNVGRMRAAEREKSVNAVIVKPNQVGTVSEALQAVRLARKFGWAVIVSHRSGETNDDFIADFAYGTAADGFKLGAPARGERIAKYNRLLEIEAGRG